MAGKLDQSLEEILKSERSGPRRRSQRRISGRQPAPVGGIQKNIKRAVSAPKPAPTKPAANKGESKILVSNLPFDVVETQIKDYFNEAVGKVKSVEIMYGQNGKSRGKANVTFFRADSAAKASTQLNGLLVDNRPLEIDILVGADQAANVIPPPKSLAERTTQPKAQPKSAANNKHPVAAAKGAPAKPGVNKKRRARTSRPTKKTAEELDSEMADYFQGAPGENSNGGAPPAAATNGDAPMDEIL